MPSDNLLFDQKLRMADLRKSLMGALDIHGERDIAIVLATLIEMAATVSDWNLQAERDEARNAKN